MESQKRCRSFQHFSQVTMPQRPAPPQPSHAILVERGLGGSFTLRWAEHEGRSMKHAWDYEVFWTVPDEEERASETWICKLDGFCWKQMKGKPDMEIT